MYTSTIISDKELDLLKSMIGKAFDKYRCDPFISSPMVYGIIGIYIDGKPVKITSLLQNVRRRNNVRRRRAAFAVRVYSRGLPHSRSGMENADRDLIECSVEMR